MTETATTVTLTCREARLLLKVIPVDRHWKDMGEEEPEAWRHYANCHGCKELGLAAIVKKDLSCREALECWAEYPGPCMYHPSTLLHHLAIEHVWGRGLRSPMTSDFHDDHFGRCSQRPCSELALHWMRAPLSSQYDGEGETAAEIPLLITIFQREGWSLERLLNLQCRRIGALLVALRGGREGREALLEVGYHSRASAENELRAQIRGYQEILLGHEVQC